jgi:hypothetical protein
MHAKDYLKKIGVHTCIYFTATTLLLLFLYFVMSIDLTNGIHPLAQICILPFSFLLGVANVFFKYAEDWEIGWRVAIHYCLTLGGAFTCLYLPNKAEGNSSGGLIIFVVLTVLYALVMGIVLGVRARIRRVTRDTGRYKNLYKENDSKKSKSGKSLKNDKDDYQNVFKKN